IGEAGSQDLRVAGGDADGPGQQVVGRVIDHGARALHAGAVGLVHLHGARQGVVGNAGDRPDRVDDLQDTAVSVIDGGRGALQAAHAVGLDDLGGAVQGVVNKAGGCDVRVVGGDAGGFGDHVADGVIEHGAGALHRAAVSLVDAGQTVSLIVAHARG